MLLVRWILSAGLLMLASSFALAQTTFPQNDPKHMEYGRYTSVVLIYESCRVIRKENYEIAKERQAALRQEFEAQGLTGVEEFEKQLQKMMLQYGCGPFIHSESGSQVIDFSQTLSKPAGSE